MQATQRIHLSIATEDLGASVAFYSNLLGSTPVLERDGYAKFVADQPALNLSLIQSNGKGVLHAGIEVDSDEALSGIAERWQAADPSVVTEDDTVCCYHRSSKVWATDPSGVAWEGFRSFGVEPEQEDESEQPLPAVPRPCC